MISPTAPLSTNRPSRIHRWIRAAIYTIAGFYIYRHLFLLLFKGGPRGDLDILLLAGKRFGNDEAVYLITDYSEHTKPPLLSPLLALIARIPSPWIRSFWDLVLLFLPFFAVVLWNKTRKLPTNLFSTAATIALMGPLWFTEAGYGQYNLLLLVLTLVALLWNSRPALWSQIAAGALFCFGVILKPTQIICLPLFLVPFRSLDGLHLLQRDQRQRWLGFFTGGGLAALVCVLSYLLFRPWVVLIHDIVDWNQFIAASQAKHLLRTDNYGIPTFLARLGFHWAQSPLLPLLGVLLAAYCWIKIRRQELGFILVILLSILFSPMSWRQNYVMLLPLAYELSQRLQKSGRDWRAWSGIALLFIVARFSAHWLSSEFFHIWGTYFGPALAAILATAMFSWATQNQRPEA